MFMAHKKKKKKKCVCVFGNPISKTLSSVYITHECHDYYARSWNIPIYISRQYRLTWSTVCCGVLDLIECFEYVIIKNDHDVDDDS